MTAQSETVSTGSVRPSPTVPNNRKSNVAKPKDSDGRAAVAKAKRDGVISTSQKRREQFAS